MRGRKARVALVSGHRATRRIMAAHRRIRWARLCQEAGPVPIVERDVLTAGAHTLECCAELSEDVLSAVVHRAAYRARRPDPQTKHGLLGAASAGRRRRSCRHDSAMPAVVRPGRRSGHRVPGRRPIAGCGVGPPTVMRTRFGRTQPQAMHSGSGEQSRADEERWRGNGDRRNEAQSSCAIGPIANEAARCVPSCIKIDRHE